MTDLEENCWSEEVCQNCGSQLRGEQRTLSFGGISKMYCSQFCYDEGLRLVTVSVPIFVAPPAMNLRQRLLRVSTPDRR